MAGNIAETSFARFRASIVTFNVERTPSRFDCWDFEAIVEARDSGDKMMIAWDVK